MESGIYNTLDRSMNASEDYGNLRGAASVIVPSAAPHSQNSLVSGDVAA
jgi:hypothetical protein